jgi:hypothetical protein
VSKSVAGVAKRGNGRKNGENLYLDVSVIIKTGG